MLKFLFNKLTLISISVILAAYMLLPSFIGPGVENLEDTWYGKLLPEKQLKLGLDLRGGIHLVLGVDVDKAVENEAERDAEDLREALVDQEIPVVNVEKSFDSAEVIVQLKSSADKNKLFRYMETRYTILTLESQDDSKLQYRYGIEQARRRQIERDTIRQALETIRNRVDEFGISEPQISTQGRTRIIVQLPGMDDPARARELIGRTAQLEFKLVSETLTGDQLFRLVETAKKEIREQKGDQDYVAGSLEITSHLKKQLPNGTQILFEEEKQNGPAVDAQSIEATRTPYLIERKVLLTGEMLDDARVQVGGQFNSPEVALRFNPAGAKVFEKVTRENVQRRLAIVLDNKISSAPVIEGPIPGGRARITLGALMDRRQLMEDARDLAIVLRAGALPAPVDILENRLVGPSLGSDSVEMGKRSLLIGAILVVLFMMLYYRKAGLVADLVLTFNLMFVLAILAAFQATLTLPGIAGLVLTVGMAVDANIIIFERIREELGIGQSMLEAVDTGFSKAHLTILDANVTTLIAGLVLLQYGSGPVKGFAVTLIIGVITSYVTALWFARAFFKTLVRHDFFANRLFSPKGS